MARVLVIGGGFAGCIAAHQLADKHEVTLIERSPHLGGGCRTLWHGGHPYTFGPRHFLTKREDVWAYMNGLCPMRRFPEHEFLTFVPADSSFYHFPICEDEITDMPYKEDIRAELATAPGAAGAKNLEEYWIKSVGGMLYGKFVREYSAKMWGGLDAREITDFGFTPKGVAIKPAGAPRAAWNEALSGFPVAANGYNSVFAKLTAKVRVLLNCNVRIDIWRKTIQWPNTDWMRFDLVVSTISPEHLFEQCFGELRWMGREFLPIVLPMEQCLPENVFFLYYAGSEPQTRVVEYKKFYRYASPHTLIGVEIPSTRNKLYPFPTAEDQAQAQKYLDLLPANVFSIGRMGSYRYLDVGSTIEQVFGLREKWA